MESARPISGVTIKPHSIRGMTKDMEQAEMKLRTSMPRNVTLHLSSMSSAVGENASGPSEPKKLRGVNTMDQAFNKEVRDELNCIITRIFYTGGLSLI